MSMSTNELKDRIQGRKDAMELLGLASNDLGRSQEYDRAFWENIHIAASLGLHNLGVDLTPPRPKLVPMNDAEARLFAEVPLPFGKHKDTGIWAVLRDDPQYLDWLVRATEEDDFKQQLRRFLARGDVQEELPE